MLLNNNTFVRDISLLYTDTSFTVALTLDGQPGFVIITSDASKNPRFIFLTNDGKGHTVVDGTQRTWSQEHSLFCSYLAMFVSKSTDTSFLSDFCRILNRWKLYDIHAGQVEGKYVYICSYQSCTQWIVQIPFIMFFYLDYLRTDVVSNITSPTTGSGAPVSFTFRTTAAPDKTKQLKFY